MDRIVRYVVMKDRSLGHPVYVAATEQVATQYLDRIEELAKKEGRKVERKNSLWLDISTTNHYDTFQVHKVESDS